MNRNRKIILIVVMFVVISCIVICVHAFNSLKKFVEIKYQYVQFNSIVAALEMFKNELGSYPPSEALDLAGQLYCGAMKFSEAIMGRDLLGFHTDSVFRADGMDATGTRPIYLPIAEDVKARYGPLLQFENANVYRLNEIYQEVGPFDGNNYVLCDTYLKKHYSGKKIGMPILYYKANTSNTEHDVNNPDNPENIYNYKDNHALLSLGVPWKPKEQHPLFVNPKIFYVMTRNWQAITISRPNRSDSYILISAGKDGLYGTKDDICNFDWKYREIENPSESKD
jgi:hypothetical protein